jgi:hypothetical protein
MWSLGLEELIVLKLAAGYSSNDAFSTVTVM